MSLTSVAVVSHDGGFGRTADKCLRRRAGALLHAAARFSACCTTGQGRTCFRQRGTPLAASDRRFQGFGCIENLVQAEPVTF